MLLWLMVLEFENTCTVSWKRNVSRVVPRLYGWVYKTLRLPPLAVEHSIVVMTMGSQSRQSQIELGIQFSILVLLNLCLNQWDHKI